MNIQILLSLVENLGPTYNFSSENSKATELDFDSAPRECEEKSLLGIWKFMRTTSAYQLSRRYIESESECVCRTNRLGFLQ